jgi:REP element-mobilizing transposase RayT
MARALRIEFEGAAYHVMARGNQGKPIFADDQDRELWVKTLAEACEKTGWRIHAYVLMANHYHLLVETPEGNLVAGMKWLQGTYTQRYNGRHSVFGHLFQGRYKALVIDAQAGNYFGVVSTYVHLNPARAGLVRAGEQALAAYPWSSYPWYVRARRAKPNWLVTGRVLENLGLSQGDGQGYEAYLEGRVLELGIKSGHNGGPGPNDKNPTRQGRLCTPIDGSQGADAANAALMEWCHEHANDGVWVPGAHDCHNVVNKCLNHGGLGGVNPGRFHPQPIFSPIPGLSAAVP